MFSEYKSEIGFFDLYSMNIYQKLTFLNDLESFRGDNSNTQLNSKKHHP
jgi:hypothetical protein